ncbi:hypothetical protein FRB90_003936 [Tulasnella sp. 427]|nr:hypothetical protein FRB90_003936 [Tulasnella sp. 427]
MSSITIQNAALQKQLHVVRSLLNADPNLLNSVDSDGRTALHWAASSGSTDIVRELLGYSGVEVNKKDSSGWTPLMIAASAGDGESVRELLGSGALVNETNDKGLTALHYAASKGRVEIGRTLLERGADVNAKDKANQHPLHRAATTGSTGFISLLINPPPNPNADPSKKIKTRLNTQDRIGNTPLHLAMESAHAEAAVLLIEAGADRDRLNSDGEAPEDMEGVGGQEQRRAKEYVISRCGKP